MSDTPAMANPTTTLEREAKLSAWPDFRLPDLTGALHGLTSGEPEERWLDATYQDAPDIRLGRAGVTLRHRSGEGAQGRWTLKVPAGPDLVGTVMQRFELTRPGVAGAPPASLVRPVRAVLRGAELVPVARLRTRRHAVPLLLDGALVG